MTVTTDHPGATPPEDDDVVAVDQGSPDGPTVARGGSRRRLVLIIICALALVAEAVLAVRVVQARSELSDADAQLAHRSEELAKLTSELDATRQRLEALRTDSANRQTETDGAARTVAVRDLELAELAGSIARMDERAKSVQAEIGQASTVDQEQARQMLLLTKCLNGIKQANLAAAAGRSNDIVAALNSVSDICQQTLQIMSPGDTSDFPFDFADPSVLYANGKYYAYATNGGGGRVQVIGSTDLKRWTWVGEALKGLPGWAVPGQTWAPSVLHKGDTYFMYYTAKQAASQRQCISVATSNSPEGPFVDGSAAPFVCQLEFNGSIDPSPFVASDGTYYVVWKAEAETKGGRGRIWIGKLGEDGKSLDGDPTEILASDRSWEDRIIEGPSMVEANGVFYLIYSGNHWNKDTYAAGYAVCKAPTGPCTKPVDNVFLEKHDNIDGPGGAEVFVAPGGQLFVSYHAWTHPNVGWPNKRQLHVEKLNIIGGRPMVG